MAKTEKDPKQIEAEKAGDRMLAKLAAGDMDRFVNLHPEGRTITYMKKQNPNVAAIPCGSLLYIIDSSNARMKEELKKILGYCLSEASRIVEESTKALDQLSLLK